MQLLSPEYSNPGPFEEQKKTAKDVFSLMYYDKYGKYWDDTLPKVHLTKQHTKTLLILM